MAVSTSASQICWPSRYWLKWLVVLFGALIVGGIIAILTAPTHDPSYHFFAYDTQGNPVKADLVKDDGKRADLGDPALKQTDSVGATRTLNFAIHGSSRELPVTITWRSSDEHRKWLNAGFKDYLRSVDSKYNQTAWNSIIQGMIERSPSYAMEYPIVFKVDQIPKTPLKGNAH